MTRPCSDCPLKGGKCNTCKTTVKKTVKTTRHKSWAEKRKDAESRKKWAELDKRMAKRDKEYAKRHKTKPRKQPARSTQTCGKHSVSISAPLSTERVSQAFTQQNKGQTVKGWTVYDEHYTVSADGSALVRYHTVAPPVRIQPQPQTVKPIQAVQPVKKVHVVTPAVSIQTKPVQPPVKPPVRNVRVSVPEMPPVGFAQTHTEPAKQCGVVRRLITLPAHIIRGLVKHVKQFALPEPSRVALPEHKTEEIMVVPAMLLPDGKGCVKSENCNRNPG